MSCVHKNTGVWLCAYMVLNLLTQLRDCNRRIPSMKMEKFSLVVVISQKAFPISGSLVGWCKPSSYPFAPFGLCLYFQAGLLIHIKHIVNSLVLGRIWSTSWKDVLIGVVIKCLWRTWGLGVDKSSVIHLWWFASASGSVFGIKALDSSISTSWDFWHVWNFPPSLGEAGADWCSCWKKSC